MSGKAYFSTCIRYFFFSHLWMYTDALKLNWRKKTIIEIVKRYCLRLCRMCLESESMIIIWPEIPSPLNRMNRLIFHFEKYRWYKICTYVLSRIRWRMEMNSMGTKRVKFLAAYFVRSTLSELKCQRFQTQVYSLSKI